MNVDNRETVDAVCHGEPSEPTGDGDAKGVGGQGRRWINGMRRRMRELLALPAPEGEHREYLTGLGVPSEDIDNSMLLMGVLFRLAADGNMRAFQELRHIAGDNETDLDRRMKLMQLRKLNLQCDDLVRRFSDDGEEGGGTSSYLAEALAESAAALWEKGGEESAQETNGKYV